jgi:hypothetical protein
MKYLCNEKRHELVGARYKKIAKVIAVNDTKLIFAFPRTYMYRTSGPDYSLELNNWQYLDPYYFDKEIHMSKYIEQFKKGTIDLFNYENSN